MERAMQGLNEAEVEALEEWASELYSSSSGFAKVYASKVLEQIMNEKQRRDSE